MKIEFEYIKFRNFLTFGNKEQTLHFKTGINSVTGTDVRTGRSNGSGKSSMCEVLTFCLFGKTSKNINKDKIINWKNKKACETEAGFKIDNAKYIVKRYIKPDLLEIYKDGVIITPPPDVRVYQKILENEILKMDHHLFTSLIYINLNDYIPILQMGAEKKRSFVEKMFGLEFFSELNKRANENLSKLENKLSAKTIELNMKNKMKIDLVERNTALGLQLKDVKSSKPELDSLIDKLNKTVNPIDEYNKSLELFNTQSANISLDIAEKLKHQSNINFLTKGKESLQESIKTKNANINTQSESKKKCGEIIELYKDIDKDIETETDRLNDVKVDVEVENSILHESELKLVKTETEMKTIELNVNKLDGKPTCPTCESIIEVDKVQNMRRVVDNYKIQISDINKNIILTKDKIKNLKKKQDENTLTKLRDKKTKYEDAKKKIISIDTIIKAINVTEDESKLSTIIMDITGELLFLKGFEDSISQKTIALEEIKTKLADLKIKADNYNTIVKQIDIMKEKIIWEDKTKADLNKQIYDNNKKLDILEEECVILMKSINSCQFLVDYISYAKNLCKDENAKAYAIKFLMPYLTKQVNHYISKSGINFYIKLDNMFEEEINGPGIHKAGYGNLSGGERRSVDLSILFALLDISRLRRGVFPDVLFLDEILDTSIDKNGLDNVIKIIEQRQADDNSKVFFISHRENIENVSNYNEYLVEKIDGFSTIKEINA